MSAKTVSEEAVLTAEQKEVLSMAKELGLDGMVEELEEQFKSPQLYEDLSYEEKLKECFERMQSAVSIARFDRMYKNSRLRHRHYIKEFKANPGRGLDANVLLLLKNCEFIQKANNIIISGPTGTGKTALAEAVGVEAITRGYRVLMYRFSEITGMIEHKDSLGIENLKRRLARIDLLILDDYGLVNFSDPAIIGLNEIVDGRYGTGTIIITTQLRNGEWKKACGKSPISEALSDRLFRKNDIVITLKGGTMRGTEEEFK